MLEQSILQNYLDILREELVPATGCTEPIAIAYCAATLRELLGALPERVDAAVSGNILKNVKSVVVPNTGGRKGIAPAIAVGLVAGDAARDLQVISAVTEKQLAELDAYLQRVDISVSCSLPASSTSICAAAAAATRPACASQTITRISSALSVTARCCASCPLWTPPRSTARTRAC